MKIEHLIKGGRSFLPKPMFYCKECGATHSDDDWMIATAEENNYTIDNMKRISPTSSCWYNCPSCRKKIKADNRESR